MFKVTASVIAIALSATIAGAQTSPTPAAKVGIPLATKATAHAARPASPQGAAATPTPVRFTSGHGHGVVQGMASTAALPLAPKPVTQTK